MSPIVYHPVKIIEVFPRISCPCSEAVSEAIKTSGLGSDDGERSLLQCSDSMCNEAQVTLVVLRSSACSSLPESVWQGTGGRNVE